MSSNIFSATDGNHRRKEGFNYITWPSSAKGPILLAPPSPAAANRHREGRGGKRTKKSQLWYTEAGESQ